MHLPCPEVVSRVREVVEDAAAEQIESGRAVVAVRRLADLFAHAEYDCPVIALTPTNPHAARVMVEVQRDELWWVIADDGPGTELYDAMNEDRYALLGALIRAVVAGRYRHGPCTEEVPQLFGTPRKVSGRFETFDTDQGPWTSRHFVREGPPVERRFSAY